MRMLTASDHQQAYGSLEAGAGVSAKVASDCNVGQRVDSRSIDSPPSRGPFHARRRRPPARPGRPAGGAASTGLGPPRRISRMTAVTKEAPRPKAGPCKAAAKQRVRAQVGSGQDSTVSWKINGERAARGPGSPGAAVAWPRRGARLALALLPQAHGARLRLGMTTGTVPRT